MRRLSLLLISAALVTGCAANGDPAAEPGASSPPATPGTQQESAPATPAEDRIRTIAVSISGGQVRPEPGRIKVDKGQRVTIRVTSDSADHVHVHGYDREAHVGPGEPAEITFAADTPGLFEVETHDSGLVLFQLAVR